MFFLTLQNGNDIEILCSEDPVFSDSSVQSRATLLLWEILHLSHGGDTIIDCLYHLLPVLGALSPQRDLTLRTTLSVSFSGAYLSPWQEGTEKGQCERKNSKREGK